VDQNKCQAFIDFLNLLTFVELENLPTTLEEPIIAYETRSNDIHTDQKIDDLIK